MFWIYRLSDGGFTGGAFDLVPPDLTRMAEHVPAGHAAWPDPVDWQRQRVGSGGLEACTPEAPVATSMVTWTLDPATHTYVPVPTFLARKTARIEAVQAAILALEQQQDRPMREVAAAWATGAAAPVVAATRVVEIDSGIAALRTVRIAMDSAADDAALDAIVWPPP